MTDSGAVLIGAGAEAAHINSVLGHRSGPAGTAWATALAQPSLGLIAAVGVNPAARDADLVYANNRAATTAALAAAARSQPSLEAVLAGRAAPYNPHYEAR